MCPPSVIYFVFFAKRGFRCDAGLKFSRSEEEVPLQIILLSLNLQLGFFWSTQTCNGSWPDVQIYLQIHLKSAVFLKGQAFIPWITARGSSPSLKEESFHGDAFSSSIHSARMGAGGLLGVRPPAWVKLEPPKGPQGAWL